MRPNSPVNVPMSGLPYELEQNLGANPEAFVDPAGFRAAMIRAERCVARIECPELEARGTGFLIAPDLLITNNHVRSDWKNNGKNSFDRNPSVVRVRFGVVAGSLVSTRTYELGPEWLVNSSSEGELDYCIVRLAEAAGEDRIGEGPRMPVRGWIPLSDSPLREKQSLNILQHPMGGPLKYAAGHLTDASGDWINYGVDTEYGSSGSPVFDCQWQCVALHSRRGSGVNRGASFRAILATLSPEQRSLLGRTPPVADEVFESVAAADPGVPVDLSQFSTTAIQAIGNELLRRAVKVRHGERVPAYVVNLGGGSKLHCVPSDYAGDSAQQEGLGGDLSLLRTQLEVLQEHREKQTIDPNSLTGFGVIIRRGEERKSKNIEIIKERLDVMVEEFRLFRAK